MKELIECYENNLIDRIAKAWVKTGGNMDRIKFIRSQFIELKALIKEMQQSDFHVMLNYNYGEFMGIYNTLDKLLTQNDGTNLYTQMSVRKELESLRIDCVNAYKYTLSQLKGIRPDND